MSRTYRTLAALLSYPTQAVQAAATVMSAVRAGSSALTGLGTGAATIRRNTATRCWACSRASGICSA